MTTTITKTHWANLSDQGTAMHETALCDACQHTGKNARQATLVAMRADDFGGMTARTKCVGNDALRCIVCGE